VELAGKYGFPLEIPEMVQFGWFHSENYPYTNLWSGRQKSLLSKEQYYAAFKRDAVHISPDLSNTMHLKLVHSIIWLLMSEFYYSVCFMVNKIYPNKKMKW
jgi:hypothetical protein